MVTVDKTTTEIKIISAWKRRVLRFGALAPLPFIPLVIGSFFLFLGELVLLPFIVVSIITGVFITWVLRDIFPASIVGTSSQITLKEPFKKTTSFLLASLCWKLEAYPSPEELKSQEAWAAKVQPRFPSTLARKRKLSFGIYEKNGKIVFRGKDWFSEKSVRKLIEYFEKNLVERLPDAE